MFGKIIRIPAGELRELEFACPACGTGVIVKLDSENPKVPAKCSACPHQFDGESRFDLASGLRHYAKFLDALNEQKITDAFFRVAE